MWSLVGTIGDGAAPGVFIGGGLWAYAAYRVLSSLYRVGGV